MAVTIWLRSTICVALFTYKDHKNPLVRYLHRYPTLLSRMYAGRRPNDRRLPKPFTYSSG